MTGFGANARVMLLVLMLPGCCPDVGVVGEPTYHRGYVDLPCEVREGAAFGPRIEDFWLICR